MKLSGKGALALLAALVVSGEEGASASGGGSESIMVCNAFAKFCYALHTSYSAANTNIHNISLVSFVYTHTHTHSLSYIGFSSWRRQGAILWQKRANGGGGILRSGSGRSSGSGKLWWGWGTRRIIIIILSYVISYLLHTYFSLQCHMISYLKSRVLILTIRLHTIFYRFWWWWW